MPTPMPWGLPADVIPSQSFVDVDISSADHDFVGSGGDGVRPRALWVNNSGTSLQTLVCRGEPDSADASFICGPGGTLVPISPRYIRSHSTLTVVALS